MAKYAIFWLEWRPFFKMAVIHFEILHGTRHFLNKGPKRDTHANVGACITI